LIEQLKTIENKPPEIEAEFSQAETLFLSKNIAFSLTIINVIVPLNNRNCYSADGLNKIL
jgi:hypothetical protein